MNILINWKEDYSVNIQRIDEQHKKLIDMINVVYDSLIRNEKDDVLERTISDMRDYAFVHFKNEEKYFAQYGYKDAASHIAEHHFFLKNTERIQTEYNSQEPEVKEKVLSFLQKWLTNHIMRSDKEYMECFLKGGLK